MGYIYTYMHTCHVFSCVLLGSLLGNLTALTLDPEQQTPEPIYIYIYIYIFFYFVIYLFIYTHTHILISYMHMYEHSDM